MIERVDIGLLEEYLAGEVEQLHDENGIALSSEEVEQAIEEYNDVVIQLEGAALKTYLKKRNGVENKQQSSPRLYWMAAAAAFLLILSFAFIWQSGSKPKFNDYFKHFKQLETRRGNVSTNYATALEAYSRTNYEEAFYLFSDLKNPTKEALFFKGVSALAIDKTKPAIDAFLMADIQPSNRYYQQTRWYLALAYWKVGDLDNAKVWLSSIPQREFNYDKAQELLEEL